MDKPWDYSFNDSVLFLEMAVGFYLIFCLCWVKEPARDIRNYKRALRFYDHAEPRAYFPEKIPNEAEVLLFSEEESFLQGGGHFQLALRFLNDTAFEEAVQPIKAAETATYADDKLKITKEDAVIPFSLPKSLPKEGWSFHLFHYRLDFHGTYCGAAYHVASRTIYYFDGNLG